MNKNSRKHVSVTLTAIASLLLMLFLIIVSGIYEPQGETFSAFNTMMFSVLCAFMLSLIAVCLQKQNIPGWIVFIISIVLLIAIIWFLASFRFKL